MNHIQEPTDLQSASEDFYFQVREEAWQRYAGAGARLSCLELAYLDSWHEAGVPLTAVLIGIERCFTRFRPTPGRPRIRSLTYCEAEIFNAAQELWPDFQWGRIDPCSPVTPS